MLTEDTDIPLAALPVDAFKSHLRLGTGFASDVVQDEVIEGFLRAALAAVEARTGKVLLSRNFIFTISAWRDPEAQGLPVAPVSDILSVVMRDGADQQVTVQPGYYRLVRDMHRPLLAAAGTLLPNVPRAGSVAVTFTAGFGAWTDVPVDLAQSVFLLGAQYYENRHEGAGRSPMPFGVMALIERWRNVRLLGGATR